MNSIASILAAAEAGQAPDDAQALRLAECAELGPLMASAARLRDQGFGNGVTYSRKIFIPLTQLCRDVCHYCTFAQAPKRVTEPYMSIEAVVALAREGQRLGCKEALFTLGDRPELRYKTARDALARTGVGSTQ